MLKKFIVRAIALYILFSFGIPNQLVAQRECGMEAYHNHMLQHDEKYSNAFNKRMNSQKISQAQKSSLVCGNTIVIPVAIHYNDPITCDDITCLLGAAESQIDAMNEDFLAANADYQKYLDLNNACAASYPLSTAPIQDEGSCVQFCLARMNHPAQSSLQDGDPAITVGEFDWPTAGYWTGYLNIFVSGSESGLGVSPFPGSANGDGFWVTHTSFGGPGFSCTSGGGLNTTSVYNLGRTGTHEAGHYLGLNHVFGSCTIDTDMNPPDASSPLINDTPLQNIPSGGNPVVNNCGDVIEDCPWRGIKLF